ncbi:hypothetical protein [Nannocystis pusilla]|uniref:hypothetical protein n=1 Tax=Nannocystis pusilla TaxID=889268 RepID=UPI003B7944C4
MRPRQVALALRLRSEAMPFPAASTTVARSKFCSRGGLGANIAHTWLVKLSSIHGPTSPRACARHGTLDHAGSCHASRATT